MGAGGDFRDDAAEIGVQVGLAEDLVRQDFRRLAIDMAHHGGGGVVAAAFDAKDGEGLRQGSGLLCGAFATGNTFAMTQTIPATVLLTRPKAAGERFAAELAVPVILSPLMETVFLDPEPLDTPPDAMVFTSENGVRGFVRGSAWRGLAFCVGERTAQEARDAGFEAESADGDLRDLNALLSDRAEGLRLVHSRGRHVAGDLILPSIPLVTYEQRPLSLTEDARRALGTDGKLIVPLFSPRSAALFAKQLNGTEKAALDVIVISQAAAEVAEGAGLQVSCVADAPDGVAMLHAIEARRS